MNQTKHHPSSVALLSLALRNDSFLDRFEEDDIHFHGDVRRAIETMGTIRALHGTKPDIQALRHSLKHTPSVLEVIEDARCLDIAPASYEMHRELLREDQIKAEVYAIANRYNILNDPFANRPPSEVLDELHEAVTTLREKVAMGRGDSVLDGRGMVEAFIEEVTQRSSWPISTGFTKLDTLTGGGFRPGQMIVLGAYTGVGKSAMLCAMASHMVSEIPSTQSRVGKEAVPVLIISIEMTSGEVEARLLSHETGIGLSDLATIRKIDALDRKAQETLMAKQQLHSERRTIFCDDTPDVTASRLRAIIRRQVRRNGVRVVFIDYIQLVKVDKRESRVQEIDELSREMKVIAKELNVTVICLAQLNRNSSKEDRKPRLSDLRESGGLEANANTVLLLSRREPEEGEPSYDDSGIMPILLSVAKNRSGATGEILLGFNGVNMSYTQR